jgi:hypothetical protein
VYSYNLAYGGATVDSLLAKPYLSTVKSLIDQVDTEYLPTYGKKLRPDAPWKANDSLFAFFIGINDVLNTYSSSNKTLVSKIFEEYTGLVEKVPSHTFSSISSYALNIRIGLRFWCT